MQLGGGVVELGVVAGRQMAEPVGSRRSVAAGFGCVPGRSPVRLDLERAHLLNELAAMPHLDLLKMLGVVHHGHPPIGELSADLISAAVQ